MDDRSFDALSRAFASGVSRRRVLRSFLGLLAGAGTASVASDQASAARRGYSGPTFPKPTATPPPCAQIGQACGAGCCSGTCCAGTCQATCGPDCSSCDFASFCTCVLNCPNVGGTISEVFVCIEDLCRPILDGCPEACAPEIPCGGV